MRGGTTTSVTSILRVTYFNPPTPCGVGRSQRNDPEQPEGFSIHPPRAGWNSLEDSTMLVSQSFQSPPCGVGPQRAPLTTPSALFQSTHPVRGGAVLSAAAGGREAISIHPPRAGWDSKSSTIAPPRNIFQSTHPVRSGTEARSAGWKSGAFQSTHPVWGGTSYAAGDSLLKLFQSTHPVRGGTTDARFPG